MTVKYLKEQLENYPDDARIYIDGQPMDHFNEEAAEIIDLICWVRAPKRIIFQTRDDFDITEEIGEKAKYLRENGFDNWKEILLEQGFTEEEINKYGGVSKI